MERAICVLVWMSITDIEMSFKSVIGLFENTIPLRYQLDPHWSFHQLIEHVQEMMTDSLEYSYYPLQRILAQHPNAPEAAFLDTSFAFHSAENQEKKNEVSIGGSRLYAPPVSINIGENEIISKFDFALTIHHDPSTNHFSCTFNASLDLFNVQTVN